MKYNDLSSGINRIIQIWQTLFRDIIVLKSGKDRDSLINIDFASELEKIAGRNIPEDNLLKIPADMSGVMSDVDLNVDTRSAVSALLIKVKKYLD